MGSEIRYYPCFQQQYHEEDWDFPASHLGSLKDKLTRLRMHERYSDAIFSVPDQMGLALRPYHHLQVPVRHEAIEFNVPNRDKPLVLHAPTNETLKGSEVIERALYQLKEEGYEFDYLPLKNLPHDCMLKALSAADVLVDELLLHGPGWLAFEAMAAGCAVATRYLSESPPAFRPPVLSIDRRNVVEQLRLLFSDRGLRKKLAEEGRQYVEQNNSVSDIAASIISRTVYGDPKEDYEPEFFREFESLGDRDRCAIELTNEIVKDESWYRN
jgi:hypothetical protein